MLKPDSRSRSGWKRSGQTRFAPATRRRSKSVEQRAVDAIAAAREHIPEYASGLRPTSTARLIQLATALGVRVRYDVLDHPSLILPLEIAGWRYLLIDLGLHRPTRDGYVIPHELGHFLAGDASEPARYHFGGHLPEAEDVADLVAFADRVSAADCAQGEEWIRHVIRGVVHLEYEPWYRRLDRLPAQLIEVRGLLDD